jgi:colanic acid biosynthesis glycosyl transferase WcaI
MFSPDGVSTAYLYNDIATGFKDNGYDVVVITTTPHFNVLEEELAKQPFKKHFGGAYYTSLYSGLMVYHVPITKYKSTLLRLISFVYFHVAALIISLFIGKIDIVMSPSPPLTIGLISIIISKLKGSKTVYNVQEIYPALLIKQGSIKNRTVIKFLLWIEKIVYNKSDLVITIDQLFYNQIVSKFIDKNKLMIIPNFVDTDIYRPINQINDWSKPYYSENLKLLYAGNIGHAQDWTSIIEVALLLKGKPVEFWIVGGGVSKISLEETVIAKKIDNIFFLPYQSRETMPEINAFADIHFIAMNDKISAEGFPSKVYTIMACAKPLIVLIEQNTPLYNFLYDKDCAILISNNKVETFKKSIEYFIAHREKITSMGQKSVDIIAKEYTKEIVVKKYIDALNLLLT